MSYNPRMRFKLGSTQEITADHENNKFTETAHDLSNGDMLYLGGLTPDELDTETLYYVVNTTTDTFQLSLTEDGDVIEFTDNADSTLVYHKTYDLGQMSWFTPSFTQNNMTRIIPRAKGVQLYSGEEMGGGLINITVEGFKIKSTRLEVETYLYNLIQNLANEYGTLIIESTLELEDCYLETITPNQENNKWSKFNLTFIKSV